MTHTIGSETYEATKTAAADWEDLIETSAEWDDLSNNDKQEYINNYEADNGIYTATNTYENDDISWRWDNIWNTIQNISTFPKELEFS